MVWEKKQSTKKLNKSLGRRRSGVFFKLIFFILSSTKKTDMEKTNGY